MSEALKLSTLSTGLTPLATTMKFKVVMMPPEMAQVFLDKNHPDNRSQKWGKINEMADDITNDFWDLNHQAIAFDTNGLMIDGQNRCEACVLADKPIPVVIVTGCPTHSGINVDVGSRRTVVDAAKISGKELGTKATSKVAIARRIAAGTKHYVSMSNRRTLEFINQHKKAIEFACECLPLGTKGATRGICIAPVLAVIARAYYTKDDRDRLKEFGACLVSGLPDNPKKDRAAILLRNWLIQAYGAKKSGDHTMRVRANIIYAKAERALRAFIDCEELEKLYATETSKELFPIPRDFEHEEGEGT